MDTDREETLYSYLERRERELTHQLAALHGQIAVRQQELTHIQSTKRQLGSLVEGVSATGEVGAISPATKEDAPENPSIGIADVAHGVLSFVSAVKKTQRAFAEVGENFRFLEFESLTIKELIVKALVDHFRDGATVSELCEFISNAYGRKHDRTSISPQLSRLRDEGTVEKFQRPDEVIDKYIVTKAFKSKVRRFSVGQEIPAPKDKDAARVLKVELEPHQLDDLLQRQWLATPSSGCWRLTNKALSAVQQLIEVKAAAATSEK